MGEREVRVSITIGLQSLLQSLRWGTCLGWWAGCCLVVVFLFLFFVFCKFANWEICGYEWQYFSDEKELCLISHPIVFISPHISNWMWIPLWSYISKLYMFICSAFPYCSSLYRFLSHSSWNTFFFFFFLVALCPERHNVWMRQYTLGGSDWAEGWTRWPPDIPSNLNHSTILCLFWHDVMFYVFCIMFSNVHSTLMLSNRNWILAIIELLVNVFTSIFEVTMRPSRSDNKFRCTFVYLWFGIHTTLHSLFFNYWINTFIFRQFNFLVTHSCEKFLLLHLVIFRLCVICELGNICELIISPFPT